MDIRKTGHEDMRWIQLARSEFREEVCEHGDESSCSLNASNAFDVMNSLRTMNCDVVSYSVSFFLDLLTFPLSW
jgi:hypothetical protein